MSVMSVWLGLWLICEVGARDTLGADAALRTAGKKTGKKNVNAKARLASLLEVLDQRDAEDAEEEQASSMMFWWPPPTPSPTPPPAMDGAFRSAVGANDEHDNAVLVEGVAKVENAIESAKASMGGVIQAEELVEGAETEMYGSIDDTRDEMATYVDTVVDDTADTASANNENKDAFDNEYKDTKDVIGDSSSERKRTYASTKSMMDGETDPMKQDFKRLVTTEKKDMKNELRSAKRELKKMVEMTGQDIDDLAEESSDKALDMRFTLNRQESLLKEADKKRGALEKSATKAVEKVMSDVDRKIVTGATKGYAGAGRVLDKNVDKLDKKFTKMEDRFYSNTQQQIPGATMSGDNMVADAVKSMEHKMRGVKRDLKNTFASEEKRARTILTDSGTIDNALGEVLQTTQETSAATKSFGAAIPDMISHAESDGVQAVTENLDSGTATMAQMATQLEGSTEAASEGSQREIKSGMEQEENLAKESQSGLAQRGQVAKRQIDDVLSKTASQSAKVAENGNTLAESSGQGLETFQNEESALRQEKTQLNGLKNSEMKEINRDAKMVENDATTSSQTKIAAWDQVTGRAGMNSILQTATDTATKQKEGAEYKAEQITGQFETQIEADKSAEENINEVNNEKLSGLEGAVGLGDNPSPDAITARLKTLMRTGIGGLQRKNEQSEKSIARDVLQISRSAKSSTDSLKEVVEKQVEAGEKNVLRYSKNLAKKLDQGLKKLASSSARKAMKIKGIANGVDEYVAKEARSMGEQEQMMAAKLEMISQTSAEQAAQDAKFGVDLREAGDKVGAAAVARAGATMDGYVKKMGESAEADLRDSLVKSQNYQQRAMENVESKIQNDLKDKEGTAEGMFVKFQHSLDKGMNDLGKYSSVMEGDSDRLSGSLSKMRNGVAATAEQLARERGQLMSSADTSRSMSRSELMEMAAAFQKNLGATESGLQGEMGRAMGISQEDQQKMIEHANALKAAMERGDKVAVAKAENAMRALVNKCNDELARASKEAGNDMISLKDGQKRWQDAQADIGSKLSLAQKHMRNAEDDIEASLHSEQEREGIADKRLANGLTTLGEETDGIGHKASNAIQMEGSKLDQQAKMAGVSINSGIQQLETNLKSGFQNQEFNDNGLARAVGRAMQGVEDVQNSAGMDEKYTQHAMNELHAILDSEKDSLGKNSKYLKSYMGRTAAQMLHLLGQLVKKTMSSAHHIHKETGLADATADIFKHEVDHVMGGEVMQTLMKIGRMDDLALRTADDNEKLTYWMEDFEKEAPVWRAGVDAVVGEEKEALRVQDEENRKAEEEQLANAARQAAGIEGQMRGAMGAMGGANVGNIEGDFENNAAMIANLNKQNSERDGVMLGGLQAGQQDANNAAEANLQKNGAALSDVQNAVRAGQADAAHLQEVLDQTVQRQNDMVEAEKKRIEARAKSFSNQLTGGSMAETDSASEQEQVKDLLSQAHELQEQHTKLDERHQQAGETIAHLFNKIGNALAVTDKGKEASLLQYVQ